MEERRRARRYAIAADEGTTRSVSTTVRVLDLSVAGVLMHMSVPLELRVRGCLRLNLGGQAFAADVEVARVSRVSASADEGYRIGAVFVGLTAEHRQMIESFTN
jgi:hypothetical protein